MSVSEALGDIFCDFVGQYDAESTTPFPPIISSEPIRRPPSPSSSLTAQPTPCNDDPRSFIDHLPTMGEMLRH